MWSFTRRVSVLLFVLSLRREPCRAPHAPTTCVARVCHVLSVEWHLQSSDVCVCVCVVQGLLWGALNVARSCGSCSHLPITASQVPIRPVCLWHTFTVTSDFITSLHPQSGASSFLAALGANLLKDICQVIHVLRLVLRQHVACLLKDSPALKKMYYFSPLLWFSGTDSSDPWDLAIWGHMCVCYGRGGLVRWCYRF